MPSRHSALGFLELASIGPEMQTSEKSLDRQASRHGLRRLAAGLIGLCGAYQIGLGIYFIALRPPLLPEDLPRLEPWLHLVFTVLGGQMAAVGALVVAAAHRLASREASDGRELVPVGMAGALSVGLMSAANFALGSDFRWLLILPAAIWALGLILAVRSRPGAARAQMEDKHAR